MSLIPTRNPGDRPPVPYRYEPLDTSKQQIRLIKLHRANIQDGSNLQPTVTPEIHCNISTFDLDAVPQYTGLSYVWGEPSPRHVIYLNGQDFHIRQNLFDFLLTFRNDDANTNYLWVNQISIDQTSTSERNHQVQLMSSIYSHRNCDVVAWLGIASQEAAYKFFQHPSFATAQDILRSQYFTRLWIVQEILLASRVRILCGRQWVEWQMLSNVVLGAVRFEEEQVRPVDWLFWTRSKGDERTRQLLLERVLERFAGMDCQDPRDKFYGILGVADLFVEVRVDYGKPLQAVYIDVITRISNNGGTRGLNYHNLLTDCGRQAQFVRIARDMKLLESDIAHIKRVFREINTLKDYCQLLPESELTMHDELDRWGYDENSKRWWYEDERYTHTSSTLFRDLYERDRGIMTGLEVITNVSMSVGKPRRYKVSDSAYGYKWRMKWLKGGKDGLGNDKNLSLRSVWARDAPI
ncbi:heterokaryon incompatibility protein-domain-containing protein [Paraphoma chrysanthemicola]|nr:heterokaryon incompatibility protein-domain-containing protein [Paraphoma chrysanthemicola]